MKKLQYQIKDGLCSIQLDDGRVNAMNLDFFMELHEALDQAEKFRCRAVSFRGREGLFSAGLDLKYMPTLEPKAQARFSQTFARTILRVFTFPIPTVAAVTGHAIAGGAILAFACDRRIILAGDYRVQMNEIKNRMALPNWMSLICATAVPAHRLTELTLHARAYNPEEAVAAGLFEATAQDPQDLDAQVTACCQDYFEFDLPSYATTKRWMRSRAAEEALVHMKDVQASTLFED